MNSDSTSPSFQCPSYSSKGLLVSPPTLSLKIKRLRPAAKLPTRAHPEDAGLDLYAAIALPIPPGESRLIHTGIALELPPHTEAQIRPRSGLALKHQVTVLNAPGTIDAGYRGEIGVLLINHGVAVFEVHPGLKIAQLVIHPILTLEVQETSTLSASRRGDRGFGSSG